MPLPLRRAFLIAAMAVTAQLDRCIGCAFVPETIRYAPAPTASAAPLLVASH